MFNTQILSESISCGSKSSSINNERRDWSFYETINKLTTNLRILNKESTKSPHNFDGKSPNGTSISVKMVLELWSKLSSNLRMRDRIVKVIQYGCQMILGYYSCQLSEYMKTGIAETRRCGSNARKAFWLLKSFNHLNSMIKMYEDGVLLTGHTADKFEFLEHLFLAIYFLTENFVFFIRSKILPVREDDIDYWVNLSWFGADLMAFIGACFRSYENYSTVWKLNNLITKCNCCDEDRFGMNLDTSLCTCGQQYNLSSLDEPSRIPIRDEIVGKIIKLEQQQGALALTWFINLFELGVSIHYVGGYKAVLGRDICDGHIGLMGVISSTLILYEGLLEYWKEMHPKAVGGVSGNEFDKADNLNKFEIEEINSNGNDEQKDDNSGNDDGGTEAITRSLNFSTGSSKNRPVSGQSTTGS